MKLNPYFNFNGNCAEAMAFYAKTLNGHVEYQMTWGDSPMSKEVPADYQDKLMHCSLNLGETIVMGCDAPPGRFRQAAGVTTSITAATVEEGQRIFDALAEGGFVQMPYGETFWAKGFGMATDKFGIPWMVNCEKPMEQQGRNR